MICRNHVDVSEGVRRCTRCGGTYCTDCLVPIAGRPYCAGCKAEQVLDLRAGVSMGHTNMVYASRWKRFGASILDGILQSVPSYAILFGVMFLTGGMSPDAEPSLWLIPAYIPFFVLPLVYEGLMLQFKNGQTVGKMALQIRVVRPDGSPITSGQAWGRAAMRVVLSCLWIVDYIPAFFTDEKTTLHDMIAGTRVIDAY